ncbi:MAG TPA: SDR family oxidoreductase [Candidatus Nanoarchaeia archaeon]|nr:SDR family oxidoreductase [Candidatus Nanoarchaeia archaeon]
MKIQEKVAIITGASSGIGLATAKLLSSKGAKLALVARSKARLEKLSSELPNTFALPADLSKVEAVQKAVKAAFEHFGRVDILVNDAGRGYDVPVANTDIGVFRYIFDLDVVAPLVAMKEVIPIMKKQGGGSIVNVSSGTALMYLPNNGPYSALKKALAHISITAREELEKDNIVISVVYPYITLTNFEENTIKDASLQGLEESPEAQEAFKKADSPEYAAQKIVEAIESGFAEIFAHDWMNPKAKET